MSVSAASVGLSKRVRRRAKVADRRLFLDLDRRVDRSSIVLGSGRGGTTWIAEQLARHAGSRLIFEPFHPYWSPFEGSVPMFIDPAATDEAAREAVARTLAGRVRSSALDQVRTARLARGRVVKEIHTTNLLPWYRANFPAVPVVYVLRHPIAASLSRLRWSGSFYGAERYLRTDAGRARAEASPVAAWLPLYEGLRQDPDPLVATVAEWCLENAYPLGACGSDPGVLVVYYERAVLAPQVEIGRIAGFCAGAIGRDREFAADPDEQLRPSAMDWFGTASAARAERDWDTRLGGWKEELGAARIARCTEVVEAFGIHHAYGAGPLPAAAG